MQKDKCNRCNGSGWFSYDENHATVCNKCCKHDKGWFELHEMHMGYEKDKNNLCCKNGCGTLKRDCHAQ